MRLKITVSINKPRIDVSGQGFPIRDGIYVERAGFNDLNLTSEKFHRTTERSAMEANANPELTEKWWSTNKAKSLRDTGVSAALRTWEAALKAHFAKTTLATYWEANDALDKLDAALNAAEKKCQSGQKETKAGLVKMQTQVDKERKALVALNQRTWKYGVVKFDTGKSGVYYSEQVGPVEVDFGFEIEGLNPYDQQRLYDCMKPAREAFKGAVQAAVLDRSKADAAVANFRADASKRLAQELNNIEQSRKGNKKHQVIIAAKGTLAVGKVVYSVGRIVITAGIDLKAWADLGKSLVGLIKLVYEEMKGVPPVFEDAQNKLLRMVIAQRKGSDFSRERDATEDALKRLVEKINKARASQANASKALDKLLDKRPEGNTPEEYESQINATVINLADTGQVVRKAEKFAAEAKEYLDQHPNGSALNQANAEKVIKQSGTVFNLVKLAVEKLAA
jgi:hypothetical protein